MVVAPTTSALPGGRFGAFRFIERVEKPGPAELYRALWSEAPSPAQRICIIKRLRPELISSPAFVRMFADEARIMTQLDHPNVVRVYQQGELEGLPYLALEALEGLPLAHLLGTLRTSGRKLAVEVAVYVAREIASALAHAHAATDADGEPLQIVHRDVRPSKVMLLSSGMVKLVDFGVARVASFVSQSWNISSVGKGQPLYVSPEQLSGALLDGRSDLFSLGVVLWEMLAGRPLFPPSAAPSEALARVTGGAVPRLAGLRPDVPAALDDLVHRLLDRDRHQRYPEAQLLLRDLQPFLPAPADACRAVSSLVRSGMDARAQGLAALLPGAVLQNLAARIPAAARPITRVVPDLAARIPGSIRRVSGLVPAVVERLRRRPSSSANDPVRPGEAAGPPAPAVELPAGGSSPLALAAGVLGPRWRTHGVQAAGVALLAFLGGALWQELRPTVTAQASEARMASAPVRAAGVVIERLPARPGLPTYAAALPTPAEGPGGITITPVPSRLPVAEAVGAVPPQQAEPAPSEPTADAGVSAGVREGAGASVRPRATAASARVKAVSKISKRRSRRR